VIVGAVVLSWGGCRGCCVLIEAAGGGGAAKNYAQ